jgi:hypothetical protein
MIDTKKYQPAPQNMKFVTRSLRSLATKLHILARQADNFGINQFTYTSHFSILIYELLFNHILFQKIEKTK